ncbi:MAG: hypothetical protein NC181_02995 [Clostridium sp.]|nr:hypothetical protein [Clostridium sp.]MCM1444204.1 hypothetical protein [Candidatus Amulumruptor caecigallinarius]
MAVRFLTFLIGFGFMVIGNIYIISYLNLMTIGYNLLDYVKFITGRFECMLSLIGFLILILTLYIPRGDKNELHI